MKTMLLIAAGAGQLAASPALAQRIPNGQLPPPGECRVWLPDRPAGQQPPPTSCRLAERQADRWGGRVVYGGDRDDDRWDDDDDDRWDGRNDQRRFNLWALRNFDLNRDGRLSRREYNRALDAWRRR